MMLTTRLATLRPRDRRALRLGAWLLLPLAIGSFIVRPYAGALMTSRATLDNERDLLARETGAVSDLPRDRATLRSTTALLADAAPRLFDGGDAVTASAELARYVSECATRSGLRLEQAETQTRIDSAAGRVTPAASAAHEAVSAAGELRVTVRARGDVLGVYAFLRAMEEGPKLVRVDRIGIARVSSDDELDGTLTLTATISGLARYGVLSGATVMAEEDR